MTQWDSALVHTVMKKLLTLIALLMPISTSALGLINDFEWLEPDNKVEVVVGESYQLKFNCSDNSLPFTNDYVNCWNHYDFDGGQHMVSTPMGYLIDDKGVITGLVPGSYAIKFTSYIQPKSDNVLDKMLMITVVSERSEVESNNTLDTANDIPNKIRFSLYNISDIDYFRYTNSNLESGDYVTFKIRYYGTSESPMGYKWAAFCGTEMVGGGFLKGSPECNALVTSGHTVYLEVYFDQSYSQYFNYGEEFVAEVFINGIPASEYGNDDSKGFDGEGTENAPYLIKNSSDLKQLANTVNSGNSYAKNYFEMIDNIDMTGNAFEPIGNPNNPFSGKFDGKGYVIKGISVNANTYIGLFGYIENAFVNDVGVEDANLTGWSNIGGIAGYSLNSVITNCYSRGLTNGNDCVGALVGYSGEGTIIHNCFSSMQHTKYDIYGSVGGLVGYNCGKLENSYFYGTINAKVFASSTTGGIVGYNHTTGSIYYCYFIQNGDVMNGEFNYCGSLNWGDCYGTDSFDLFGITTSGNYLHSKLNTWVDDHSNEGRYRKWTSEGFPSFSVYAESIEQQNVINGHEYIDLGLPSGRLWAKTNYDASNEGEYGAYVDWYARDIVQSVWGEEWSTPTQKDFVELVEYCSFSWGYDSNSVYGCYITGANGNSIFLPAAGFKILGTPQVVGSDIYYWTDNEHEPGFAYALQGSAGNDISVYQTWNTEYAMFPIRPIANKIGSSSEEETCDFVDLALPSGLLWATTNLGATRPEESGYYYAWGETTPNKSLYDVTTYTDPGISNISGTEYDAAYITSGGKWRMPTYDDFSELINNCTWEYTQIGFINGYKVKGKNGNSIFLPFVGGKEDNYNVGYIEYSYSGQGFYASGTAFPYEYGYGNNYNWYLYMDTDPTFGMYGYNKTRGQTIRPIQILSTHIDGNITEKSLVSGNIYTLDGRLVLKNVILQEATKILPKGIYVANGKKFFVK